jgi:hypothetical protein
MCNINMSTKLRISKLDAARRQLDCAIKLWFRDDDAVSIHTLAFSAYAIIEDLNVKRGNAESTMLAMVKRHVKPENVETVMQALKKAMTFFKHANRDAEGILAFDPAESVGVMRLSVIGLDLLGEQLTDFQRAFVAWEAIHSPELFIDPRQQTSKVVNFERMRKIQKGEFLKEFLVASAHVRGGT